MTDITKKFKDFKYKKIKNFDKEKEFDTLSDDIIAFKELDNGTIEKIKEPIQIVKIVDIIKDPDKIKKLDEIAGGPAISTDLNIKQVKRGDVIWITAFIQKPGSSSWTAQMSQAVLKCRIVDIYMGLNKLNTLK